MYIYRISIFLTFCWIENANTEKLMNCPSKHLISLSKNGQCGSEFEIEHKKIVLKVFLLFFNIFLFNMMNKYLTENSWLNALMYVKYIAYM